ncbi:unnamed protein product [Nippostrongylus brasiliensis]|uniref:Uncharacterized protein n=1 Tax=Nippostrongylus brasiliensis TaxID=27835 RepID=A0A0N4Y0H9_NIPBR|nr:unnamed protein product [Nippostrongylus brasiliensis]
MREQSRAPFNYCSRRISAEQTVRRYPSSPPSERERGTPQSFYIEESCFGRVLKRKTDRVVNTSTTTKAYRDQDLVWQLDPPPVTPLWPNAA